MSSSAQFEIPENQNPADAISSVKFAPHSNKLLVASWDKHVYLYEITSGIGTLINKFEHRAPVLDVCFGKDDDEAFSCGLDWDVRRIDLTTGAQNVLSTHSAPANRLVYSNTLSLLISASWDSTLHFHSLSGDQIPASLALPSKAFSLSLTPTKLVVAMASRALHIYELSNLHLLISESSATDSAINTIEAEPWQRRESSLKYMTRAVACMPNDAGYASSSIEGRVAVEWFDPSNDSQARKYAFKCHRQTVDGVDVVYPVNALAFHPVHGTFASGGGDGIVAIWDAVAKRRIRQYHKFPASVAALDFSTDGKFLAVACSPGFEDGKEDLGEGSVSVVIRELGEVEAKGKAAK
ncbi:putative nuclear pore complex subunit [Mytilinidion resinicola]|uniref:Nuclear pore complex subunit n=1 Tax=Mytilinidion resinicola TaxID=574789 RepID=A0A6A6Y5L6_9PEZI|nr:putative nuclear pore complex subunit [Mytilinidion resinicola]KAF2803077.1 putative nuclear pore complex subunit [Mytilinidion resinicola]